MLIKFAATSLNAFALSAVLLFASVSPAFAQGERRVSEHQSREAARLAEASFQHALISFDANDHEAVRLRLMEASRLWSQIGEPVKAAKAALQIGDRYKQARQYRYALKYYEDALNGESVAGPVKMNVYHSLGLLYAEIYQGDLALRNFNLALKLASAINDPSAQMLTLTSLADFYHRRGALEQARKSIAQARRLTRNGSAVVDPALLYLQGRISQEEGLFEKAKAAYEEALAFYRKTGDVAGQVRALCSLSNLALRSSQKQAALEHALQAVELADKQAKLSTNTADRARARELQWPASLSRARAALALGQKESARKAYVAAVSHMEALWWSSYIMTEAGAVAFREEIQAAYREFVDLLVELGRSDEAFEFADQAKAGVSLNLITTRRGALPPNNSKQEAALRALSQAAASLRLQLLSSNISREQQARLQKELDDAEFEMQKKQVEAEIEDSKRRLVWAELASAEKLQKRMARDQWALAEFFLGEDRSFVWLFTRGEVLFQTLPPRREIEQAVRSYLAALASAPNHFYIEDEIDKIMAKGEALFATLFGGLSAQLDPGRRLIVVPDGLLHYLPFGALIHNGRYLIEDHEISYNPSASLLNLWRESGSRRDSSDQMELLAVGDPLFETQPQSAGGAKPKRNEARQRDAARRPRLTSLPATRDEVQHISGLFPPDRRKMLIGKESTEAAIKREALGSYRRLHFATHGLIDEETPWRSGVVLTPDAFEDGLLDVREISRLDLDCDLVVVSACRTGRGKLLSGEGVIGLSRAFLHAGSRSVIVSLWNVADISTGRLMKSFYQHVNGGLSNAAALRQAKLQMLGGRKLTRHPYYWSSFVMIGKP